MLLAQFRFCGCPVAYKIRYLVISPPLFIEQHVHIGLSSSCNMFVFIIVLNSVPISKAFEDDLHI
jgi:hypothetical protein